MGVSFHCWAGYGMKISEGRLYTERERPGCTCASYYKGSGKFCQNCGSPKTVGKDVPVDGFVPDDRKFCGMEVAYDHYDDTCFVMGYCLEVSPDGYAYEVSASPMSMEEARSRLRAVLEPRGLWDEAAFGMVLVGRVSC